MWLNMMSTQILTRITIEPVLKMYKLHSVLWWVRRRERRERKRNGSERKRN
jgi:hypothetical protein